MKLGVFSARAFIIVVYFTVDLFWILSSLPLGKFSSKSSPVTVTSSFLSGWMF
jgi:hypothetical protein